MFYDKPIRIFINIADKNSETCLGYFLPFTTYAAEHDAGCV